MLRLMGSPALGISICYLILYTHGSNSVKSLFLTSEAPMRSRKRSKTSSAFARRRVKQQGVHSTLLASTLPSARHHRGVRNQCCFGRAPSKRAHKKNRKERAPDHRALVSHHRRPCTWRRGHKAKAADTSRLWQGRRVRCNCASGDASSWSHAAGESPSAADEEGAAPKTQPSSHDV